ncbi:molybdopterin molybdotransferase MoeA [Streptomyces sp. NPDC051561]|uniref:molybdopterin molybdotransferase MoeA n=1 Tax=Streptomyces sp. NPDC051561 TaxID=3365658 RepID=UPI0037B7492E
MHSWADARRVAATAVPALPAERLPLSGAVGRLLATPLAALTDLPAFDSSAMDGWAVCGSGPWRVRGQVLAGSTGDPLAPGEAVAIATGAPVPAGAALVLRSEDGYQEADVLVARTKPAPVARTALNPVGRDIRPRGQECRAGDPLLAAGTPVTPAVVGLAAACGYDTLTVTGRPTVDLLVLGDELLDRGLPGRGRVRDALGPLLVTWLDALGVRVAGQRRVPDDLDALCTALADSSADVVLTTGGSAHGPVDHVRRALTSLGARTLVDSVAVRPGHPMLLDVLPDGRPLVGLPGNPLAAVAATATLAVPVLRTLAALPPVTPVGLPAGVRLAGRAPATALVPVTVRDGVVHPLDFHGPAMLRGLAACDALAVVPPQGTEADTAVELLPRPGDVEVAGAAPVGPPVPSALPAAFPAAVRASAPASERPGRDVAA